MMTVGGNNTTVPPQQQQQPPPHNVVIPQQPPRRPRPEDAASHITVSFLVRFPSLLLAVEVLGFFAKAQEGTL